MSVPTLFIDRDGTLIEEPVDEQVDSLAKVRFMPGVFGALAQLRERGYRLVMISNQDGLGAAGFPREAFEAPQRFILDAFRSQGVEFDEVLICPHLEGEGCGCRKPKTGLVEAFLRQKPIDRDSSAVIGDRDAVDVTYDHPVSYGIRRCEFDHYLLQRSRARLLLGTPLTNIRRDGGQWVVNDDVRASPFSITCSKLSPGTAGSRSS